MASAVIGALRVTLGIDAAQFSRGLDDSRTRMKRFGDEAKVQAKALATIAIAAAAAAVALGTALVKKSMETIDAQAKLAQRIGGSVSAIQTLEYAADLAGVSQEGLTKTVEVLNARLGEAAREGAGKAYDAFQRLGLSVDELSKMDVDQRIAAIADRMKELGYTTQQQADFLRQLGIRGQEAINLIQGGGDAIRASRKDVEGFGIALSDVDAAKIEAANDALKRVGAAATGVGNQIAKQVSPYIAQIANDFADAAREAHGFGGAVKDAVEIAGASVGWLADEFQQLSFLYQTGATLGGLVDVLSAKFDKFTGVVGSDERLKKAQEAYHGLVVEMQKAADTPLASESLDAWMVKAEKAAAIRAMFATDFAPDKPAEPTTPDPAAQKRAEEMAKQLATLEDSLLSEREAEQNSYAQRMTDLADFHDKRLLSDQQYAEDAAKVEEDHAAKLKTIDEQVAENAKRALSQRSQAMETILGSVQSALYDLFGDSKEVSIAMALINTAEGITKALTLGPWGFPAAAAVAAAGAAQIAAIMRTNPGSGSSTTAVSDTSGGAASGSTGAAASPTHVVYLDLIGTTFGRDQVRALVEQLKEYQRDGGTIIIK